MYRRPYLLTALVCLGLLASTFAYFPITSTIARAISPNQPDYLSGWSWYQQVTITNSTAAPLTDYQVLINLNAGNFVFANARIDGGDIRVTDTDQVTLLSYWLENYNSVAQTARLWVKVPSIPIGSKTIWLVYGNSTATTISNGAATFDFFDDFESPTVTYGYYNLSSPGTTVMVQDQSWENSAPHTLDVVEWDHNGYRYWGYYSLQSYPQGDGIGLARSNDLANWVKYGPPSSIFRMDTGPES